MHNMSYMQSLCSKSYADVLLCKRQCFQTVFSCIQVLCQYYESKGVHLFDDMSTPFHHLIADIIRYPKKPTLKAPPLISVQFLISRATNNENV